MEQCCLKSKADSDFSFKESKTAEKTMCPRRALCEDPSPACSPLFKSDTSKGPKQYSSLKDQPPPKKRGRPWKKPLPCEEEVYSLSVKDGNADSLSEVQYMKRTKNTS